MVKEKRQTPEERKETEALVTDLMNLDNRALEIVKACVFVLLARDEPVGAKAVQQ